MLNVRPGAGNSRHAINIDSVAVTSAFRGGEAAYVGVNDCGPSNSAGAIYCCAAREGAAVSRASLHQGSRGSQIVVFQYLATAENLSSRLDYRFRRDIQTLDQGFHLDAIYRPHSDPHLAGIREQLRILHHRVERTA